MGLGFQARASRSPVESTVWGPGLQPYSSHHSNVTLPTTKLNSASGKLKLMAEAIKGASPLNRPFGAGWFLRYFWVTLAAGYPQATCCARKEASPPQEALPLWDGK